MSHCSKVLKKLQIMCLSIGGEIIVHRPGSTMLVIEKRFSFTELIR